VPSWSGPVWLAKHKMAARGGSLWRSVQSTYAYVGLVVPWASTPIHPGVGGFVVALILGICVCVFGAAALLAGDLVARYLSSRVTRPRRRWQYFLFSLGYAALVVVIVNSPGAQTHASWWASRATTQLFFVAALAAVIAFSRGALRGRLRRVFWRYPPPGLAAVPPAS
jgi:hypothetical protein